MASPSNGTSCCPTSPAAKQDSGEFLSVKSPMDGSVYEIPIYKWESSEADKKAYSANLSRHSNGLSCDQVAKMYDEWATQGTYEQDLCLGRYNGPRYTADAVTRHVSNKSRDIRILDVAAGTGMMGLQLASQGFTNLDALDGSSVMLEQAAKTGVYGKCIQELFGAQDSKVLNDSYDVIAIAGGMGEGHIPCSALSEMVRVVTPGGLVVIVMRREYLTVVDDYRDRLEPAMERLVQKGCWQRVETVQVPCYSFGKDGMVYVFRVTQNGAPDFDAI